MENEPILCFQHCESDVNILCLQLPQSCPVCSQNLYRTPLKIPPFRLPTPFTTSAESPFSIVIKPTNGTFISDYANDADLHVGITDSRGTVYDYSTTGVGRHQEGWEQILAVHITPHNNYSVTSVWDVKLLEFCAYDRWTPDLYDENGHNCYTFGLEFLRLLAGVTQQEVPGIEDKSVFCEQKVLPLTIQAAKYISMFRKLSTEHVIVQYNTSL